MTKRTKLGMARLENAVRWRLRRAVFLARNEWFRSPPFVMRYRGFNLEYGKGDVVARIHSIQGQYEPHVMSYVQSNLRRGATIVDIGANIGLFSMAVLAMIPESLVHMFEPSPVPRRHLARTIDMNRLAPRAVLNSCALYSEPGEMEFCVHEGKHAAYDGLRDTHYALVKTPRRIKVPVTTLDNYITETGIQRLDLIKIDVEGAELYVLQGAKRTLKELRPRVIFEVGQQNLDPYGLRPEHVYQFFKDEGYHLQSILGKSVSEGEYIRLCTLEHEFVAFPGS